jgi:hypothetical protein
MIFSKTLPQLSQRYCATGILLSLLFSCQKKTCKFIIFFEKIPHSLKKTKRFFRKKIELALKISFLP